MIENTVFYWARIAIIFGILTICKGEGQTSDSRQTRKAFRGSMRVFNLSGDVSMPHENGAEDPLSSDSQRAERGRPNTIENYTPKPDDKISEAVIEALGFFARKQHADGYWQETSSPVAHTGLVILSYLSYGVTHESVMHKGTEPYTENVKKALDWLVAQVGPDGALRDGGRMYDQAAGTYALAEAYMVTKDSSLREPLQKAVKYLVDGQHDEGGWRYNRGNKGDLSVSGWVISALVSARNAGVSVPDEVFKKAGTFVLALHSSDGKYGYRGKGFKLTMSAVGMFSLQLLGQEIMGPIVGGSGFNGGGGGGHENNNALYRDLIGKSSVILMQHLPEDSQGNGRPFYYWYYGTFAMRILGGNSWTKWKSSMHNKLLPMQVKDGSDNGSWDPRAGATGRIVTTAWVVLTMMAPDRPGLDPVGPIGPERPPNGGPGD